MFSKKKVKTDNFVVNSTLNMWKKYKQILGVEIGTPTHIKIWNNPSVKIQGTKLMWKTWMNGGIEILSDITSSINQISSFDTLRDKFK